MASFPDFDPNAIAGAMARDEKKRLDENILKPWLNRSIQGQYAPASTFKVVTALAALERKVIGGHDEAYCPGYYRLGRRNWRCHRDAGHGHVSLKDALKVSCDTYFYSIAAQMGIDPIAVVGKKLGLGLKTGIPLRGEKAGIMPNEAFHDRVDRKTGGYQKGMSLNTSIGQGSVLTTPLQMAVVYSAIANGGNVLVPQLIRRVETADFRVRRRVLSREGEVVETTIGVKPEVIFETEPVTRAVLDVAPEDLEQVRRGLVAVAQEPGGTAYWRRSREVSMAGKTGTAQVVRLGTSRLKAEEMAYFERDHAWFVAYAPIDDPEIVVSVINEHSGHGGSKAGPIAVRVIDAWYRLNGERGQRAATGDGRIGSKL
jgi:penicillin-binding protein 2